MFENLSVLEKINAAGGMLDRLAELKGREKCANICVLSDLIEAIHKDVLIMQEQLKDKASKPEVKIELVPEEPKQEEEA